jgi:hypothetical protein
VVQIEAAYFRGRTRAKNATYVGLIARRKRCQRTRSAAAAISD